MLLRKVLKLRDSNFFKGRTAIIVFRKNIKKIFNDVDVKAQDNFFHTSMDMQIQSNWRLLPSQSFVFPLLYIFSYEPQTAK